MGSCWSQRAMGVRWVAVLCDKPAFFPSSLSLHVASGAAFCRPDALTGADWVPIVGAVQPVAMTMTGVRLAQVFGWEALPKLSSIVRQLAEIVRCYRASEKAQYLAVIVSVYDVLSRFDPSDVIACLGEIKLHSSNT